jgi:hypothetical protein
VALAAQQEQVRDIIAASKRACDDMATLKGDTVPTSENFVPVRVGTFDVVLVAVVKSASPTAWLFPIKLSHESGHAIFPKLEYLSSRWKLVVVSKSFHGILRYAPNVSVSRLAIVLTATARKPTTWS